MRYVYLVEDRSGIIFITHNFVVAARYWWKERRYVNGLRPDIWKYEIGRRGKCECITDDEIQDYINKHHWLFNLI